MADKYGEVLNNQEPVEYDQSVGGGFDNSANQPHRMPTYVSQTGPAGSCLINCGSSAAAAAALPCPALCRSGHSLLA